MADRRGALEEEYEESPERRHRSILQYNPAQCACLVCGVTAQHGDDGEVERVGAGGVVDIDERDIEAFGEEGGVGENASTNTLFAVRWTSDDQRRDPATASRNSRTWSSFISRLVARNTF